MPTPEIYAQMSTEDLRALKAGQYDQLSDDGLRLLKGGAPVAEERPPGPGVPAGEGAPKPTFWQNLLGGLKSDVTNAAEIMPGMIPGPLGAAGAGVGSVAGDLLRGETPSMGKAGTAAMLSLILGGLGKSGQPLSQLRIAGTGKAADAALAAGAVRGAGTALQPGNKAADLMDMMRGAPGERALGAARGASSEAVAQQLPTAPKPVDRIAHADSPFKAMEPPPPEMPALSREGYTAASDELTKLGRQGFNLRGAGRDSPQAVAAREQYGEQLAALKQKLEAQGGPGLLGQEMAGRRDVSAGNELRRLFRGNSGEGPDRVFRPNGFNMQDLQERAGKRVGEIQSRFGQTEGDAFLKKLYRGGKPGEGTDRAVPLLNTSKFGGFRVNLPITRLAGPGMDTRLLQMLLRGGGQAGMPTLWDALQ